MTEWTFSFVSLQDMEDSEDDEDFQEVCKIASDLTKIFLYHFCYTMKYRE